MRRPARAPAAGADDQPRRSESARPPRGRRRACCTQLDDELVGLAPVKSASARSRRCCWSTGFAAKFGLTAQAPTLHMSFTGNPGTGKTTVATAHGRDPAPARLRAPRPPGRGHPRRSGRPVHRPHRAEDQGGAEEGDGRGAVHRRGLLPLPAGERARLRPGGDRDPAAGDGEQARRPGRHPRRLRATGWTASSAPIPGSARGSPTTSTSPTTPSTSCWLSGTDDRGNRVRAVPGGTGHVPGLPDPPQPPAQVRQRAQRPQRRGTSAAAARQPPVQPGRQRGDQR